MSKLKIAVALAVVSIILGTRVPAQSAQTEGPQDQAKAYATPYDPISPINEKLLSFNIFFDNHVARPLAKGWAAVVPYRARLHIRTFFRNTEEPKNAISFVLQKRFIDGGTSAARFAINTTLGGAGFFDVADSWFGLERAGSDFGLTAGHYSVDFGPYLMLPVGGASSVRDAVGDAAAGPANPLSAITWALSTMPALPITMGLAIIGGINARSLNLEEGFEGVDRYAVDLYGAVQDAYYQKRLRGQTSSNGAGPQ